MIEARQLTKVFQDRKRGEIRVPDAVSFRCQPGEIFGRLGVNGAGKTTCLRILGTILQPSSGTASVGGFDVSIERSLARRVSVPRRRWPRRWPCSSGKASCFAP
jgi:sodium transport system ATP-binding protein